MGHLEEVSAAFAAGLLEALEAPPVAALAAPLAEDDPGVAGVLDDVR